jgi:hypothetical protein
MNHYVLGSKIESGCPISLVSEAFLYDKYSDPSNQPEESFGYLPWYAEPETCSLPETLFLISNQAKSYDFDARSIKKNILIVSAEFLEAIRQSGMEPEAISRVKIFNKKGPNLSKKEYFAIRVPIICFESAVDVEKSDFDGRPGRISLKKLKIKDEVNVPLFLIGDLIGIQTTLICCENFFKGNIWKGVSAVEDMKAKWQGPFDFLEKQGGVIKSNIVWPV